MLVFPAIDLLGGAVVRLEQGRPERATVYAREPAELARGFAAAGAPRLHVVDLDAALSAGARHNREALRAVAAAAGVDIEAGGGVRSLDDCERLFALGVRYAVLGTAAVKQPALVAAACARFPGRIVIAVDAREGRVAVEGWSESTGQDAGAVGEAAATAGAAAVLYTDIGRDGMRTGPNLEATARMAERIRPCPLIASGGVARLEDLDDLGAAGAFAAIVGKALYAGAFTAGQAIARAAGEA